MNSSVGVTTKHGVLVNIVTTRVAKHVLSIAKRCVSWSDECVQA